MEKGNAIFLGWAKGRYEAKDKDGNPEMRSYANIFVCSPVSDYESEDYKACGMKAEKLKAVSPDVWEGVKPGEEVTLYKGLDDKIALITSTGRSIDLLPE